MLRFALLPWSAPEVLKQDRSTDPFRSDIRSHGVVVWEVTTGQMPWQGQSIIVILNGVGNNGWALQMPQDSAPALITVFNKCCAWIRRKESPSMRSRKFCSLRWIRRGIGLYRSVCAIDVVRPLHPNKCNVMCAAGSRWNAPPLSFSFHLDLNTYPHQRLLFDD